MKWPSEVYTAGADRNLSFPLLSSTAWSDGTYTVVTVTSFGQTAMGVSKRNPSDKDVPQIGETLAHARALRNLGTAIEVNVAP